MAKNDANKQYKVLLSGRLDKARIYLEEPLRQDAENFDLLHNLGLWHVDLGQLDKGRELLHRCLLLAPGHSHACVALALGYQRTSDLSRAKEYTLQALAADPRNPVALKNLGAILGKEKGSLRALYYLRRFFEIDPQDPQTVYSPAFAYMQLGDIDQAQKNFQKELEMEAPEELCGLVRGPRINAVYYLLDVLPPFDSSPCVPITHFPEKWRTRFPQTGDLLQKRSAKALPRGPGSFQRTCWTGSEDGKSTHPFP